ncbi:PREDICTED: motile sperm domain-containing protein 1-like [Ceratosolen solmsi marchali]|uniref:Motile sperm domain-containing protein 1-like n=1 Tax=Ceratosolen solmsi marchali TaxID=326594 RepID=A0AAJ6YL34_9HYME|nr:PREDICTED: motile sperm domain-containing protein 1-like [Ceratosolen solmsi marchali]
MQSQLSVTPRKLPVFVFPQNITFYLDDQSTHKQILTLYNPYDFPVKFKIFCTAPNKYVVVDPEGTIKARSCVDIVVRHIALSLLNCTIDKFRIQMLEYPNKQIIGKREVEAKVVSGIPEPLEKVTPEPELFQQIPSTGKNQQSYALMTHNKSVTRDTNYVALLAGIICIAGLLLPTEGERNLRIPDYLHLSIHLKLILSFVLGMVTIIVLRL